MTKTTSLHLDLIRIDGGTQSRIKINEDTVEDYAEILRELPATEWPFPPLDVFYDGSEYFLSDGFHRDLGALRAKRASAPCVIHKGTALDALIHGMTANDKHGLRRSHADKRFNVEQLLDNGRKMTQKEIATSAGVSLRLVSVIVAERKPKPVPVPAPQKDAHGAHSGAFDGFEPSSWTDTDGSIVVETSPTITTTFPTPPVTGNGKPPKQYDRSAYYKQWNTSIGPLIRMVDKMARDLNEMHGARHRGVKEGLDLATRNMMEWMGVKL